MLRLPIAVLAVLALAAPAAAKQSTGGRICGTDGCHELGAIDGHDAPAGRPASPPRPAEPFLQLSLRYQAGERTVVADYKFFPASGVLTGDGVSWSRPDALEGLRRAARGLTPYGGAAAPAPPQGPGGGRGGGGEWWIALLAAPFAIGIAVVAAVRRRHRGPARAPAA